MSAGQHLGLHFGQLVGGSASATPITALPKRVRVISQLETIVMSGQTTVRIVPGTSMVTMTEVTHG